jgi:hypothetical protein
MPCFLHVSRTSLQPWGDGDKRQARQGRASGGQSASALWNGFLAGGWITGHRSQSHYLDVGSGEAQAHEGPHDGQCDPAFDCLRRKARKKFPVEGRCRSRQQQAIPKRAGALAAGGSSLPCRLTLAA